MWSTEIEYTGKCDIPDTVKLADKDRLIDAIKQVTENMPVIFCTVVGMVSLIHVSGNKRIITFGVFDSNKKIFAHGSISESK